MQALGRSPLGGILLLVRFVLWFAWLGFISLLLLTLLGGATFAGYSHLSQFISELGATGAPREHLIRFAGFLPTGVFMCLFAAGAFVALPRSPVKALALVGVVLYAMGYVAAAFFPCDPGCRPPQPSLSQVIHNLVGLVGYLLAPLFLLAFGVAARRWPGGGFLAVASFVCAAFTLVGMLTLSPQSSYAGVSQRVIETSVWVWVIICAWYIRSRSANAA